jgi:hypothetical protein
VVAAALALLLTRPLWQGDNAAAGSGAGTGTSEPQTHAETTRALPTFTTPSIPATPDGKMSEQLTPRGARAAVAALSQVMGGSKVSELDVYTEHAQATAPTKAVKNGFDNFEYRDGTAKRLSANGVDADRKVLDLNAVNWDALPRLWQRADKELGVDKPTLRYIIVDTDIIEGTGSLKLYLSDDYGAAYLQATLAGKVVQVYPRE